MTEFGKEITDIVSDFYNMKLTKVSDFEMALMKFSKEELVQFILDIQCKGWLKGCYKWKKRL